MNYFTDFLNREKIKSPDVKNRLNLLNPDCEYSQTPSIPPADGLHRRGCWIMPTKATMKAYEDYYLAKAVRSYLRAGERTP